MRARTIRSKMRSTVQLFFWLALLWPKTFSQNVFVPVQENEVSYEFQYNINDLLSGVVSHRWERRYGDYVKGSYSFLEPTGMIRHVYYEVDGNHGYKSITKLLNPQQVIKSIAIQPSQV